MHVDCGGGLGGVLSYQRHILLRSGGTNIRSRSRGGGDISRGSEILQQQQQHLSSGLLGIFLAWLLLLLLLLLHGSHISPASRWRRRVANCVAVACCRFSPSSSSSLERARSLPQKLTSTTTTAKPPPPSVSGKRGEREDRVCSYVCISQQVKFAQATAKICTSEEEEEKFCLSGWRLEADHNNGEDERQPK